MALDLNSYMITIASGTVTPVLIGGELDWRNDGNQNRTLAISGANAGDSFLIEFTLDKTNWVALQAASTAATFYVVHLTGPYAQLRITKTGTNGAATVTAIV